jgi:hypothetical protein
LLKSDNALATEAYCGFGAKYLPLKERGRAGDSFNDVVIELLELGGNKEIA